MVDYIVVGAGSAGCVLAHRLTENSDATVLLLEAGGKDTHPDIHIPIRWFNLLNTEIDWSYKTEPQPHLYNRVIEWNRGKVLGGTSSINALIYIRGHRWDYDHWAELGNEGWSYAEVLPYFVKAEDQERGASEYHGVKGPLGVTDIHYESQASKLFIKAGLEYGLPLNDDFNGATQEGVGRYQVTQKNLKRHSTAAAYLTPILNRPNLTVEIHAHVTRILFNGNRAIGVEYVQNNQKKQAHAGQEVILSGGAINSPQLLLCSGIGSADHLKAFDIPVLVDLPGVGKNLQDHPQIGVYYTSVNSNRVDSSLDSPAFAEYQKSKTGVFAGNRPDFGAFVKTLPDTDIPDMQILATEGYVRDDYDLALFPTLLRAKSRGTLTLRSANPFDYPILQPNYLEHPYDVELLVESVKLSRELINTKAFEGFIDKEVAPGSEVKTNSQIEAWIRKTVETVWHYSGTCKMGIDAEAVVNPQLQVYGVEGLRVVDAAIMPEVIGGNTNAPTIMIAEKAADMIKGENSAAP